jgi:hypothetical protein
VISGGDNSGHRRSLGAGQPQTSDEARRQGHETGDYSYTRVGGGEVEGRVVGPTTQCGTQRAVHRKKYLSASTSHFLSLNRKTGVLSPIQETCVLIKDG